MNLDNVFKLILENDDKLLRYYRGKILKNFKKNSKSEQVLSERQYCIMYLIIYRNINKVTDLAYYLGLSKANISILVTKLEDNNFINRDKSETLDSRVTILTATDEGRYAFEQIRGCLIGEINTVINNDNIIKEDIYNFANELRILLNVDREVENVEDFIIFIAIRVNRIFEEMYTKIIKQNKFNLSVAETRIIKTLGMQGRVNFEVLADTMGISYSTVSLQVKKLEDKSYITKEKCDIDGRITYLTLSEDGLEVEATLLKYKRDIIISRFKDKTDDEIEHIQGLLNDLGVILECMDDLVVS